MQHQTNSTRGPLEAEHNLAITRDEAANGTWRTVRFHGADGQMRTMTVGIPAGVITGSRVRVEDTDNTWMCGDLIVVITVVPHQHCEYRGNDLYLTLQIDRSTALRDGVVHVPVGQGRFVAAPVDHRTWLYRYNYIGQGLPHAHNPNKRGDLILRLELLDTSQNPPPTPSDSASQQLKRNWWQSLFGKSPT